MLSLKSPFGVICLILLVCTALVFSNSIVVAGKGATEVIIIKSPGCTKCAAAERTLGIVGQTVPLNVTGYYYYTDEGHRVIKQYNAKDVPAIIIGTRVINYRDYDGNNSKLEQLILEALANPSSDVKPAISLPSNESQTSGEGRHSRNGERAGFAEALHSYHLGLSSEQAFWSVSIPAPWPFWSSWQHPSSLRKERGASS